ncbi:MAG: lipopolysaccharide export system permease protein [Bacteroidia bacterium]|jgi:lipopolysaccharide export system permease protein
MIKTIDKFVLKRFFGPFLLTFSVVLFIFLVVNLMKYFKHFVGKDLGADVFFEFFFYFSLATTPIALPLAVLLASLMSFGGLGQHSELTAIKGAGISLLRILIPVGVFVVFVTIGAIYFNETISPMANLKAYSLLYDIRQKKPTLDLKKGEFYNGLPGYSIKISDKSGVNGQDLEGLMIYNHSANKGNTDLILADKGRMYTMGKDDSYLVLELFNGSSYRDFSAEKNRKQKAEFIRQEFDSSKIVFSMASFGLSQTREELFKGHNMMKTSRQLKTERDSLEEITFNMVKQLPQRARNYHSYQFHTENEAWKQKQREEDEARLEAEKKKREEQKKALKNEDGIQEIDDSPKEVSIIKTDTIKKENLPENPKVELSKPSSESVLEKLLARKKLKEENSTNQLNKEEAKRLTLAQKKLNNGVVKKQPMVIAEGKRNPDNIKTIESTSYSKQKKNGNSVGKQIVQNPTKQTNKQIGKERKGNSHYLKQQQTVKKNQKLINESLELKIPKENQKKEEHKTLLEEPISQSVLNSAWSKANGIKGAVDDVIRSTVRDERRLVKYEVDIYMKLAQSIAVFVMFLIGAPLGAIIKKGGLGVPVLISIVFFVIYYISTIIGKKYAEEMVVSPLVGCWAGIGILFLIGLFCLRQAYADARLLDFDYYTVQLNKLKTKLTRK